MINVMDSVDASGNEVKKCLDSKLWHACAGGMVRMPALNSKVCYFPQGHAEHATSGNVNFGDLTRIPPCILCRVSSINFMADPGTDEVYAKIGLIPLMDDGDFDSDYDGVLGFDQSKNENEENVTSFAKTLTQSDANNGGGFSVPRYCAETIFPSLDYSADPPLQTIVAKDVHGEIWKFRHIYRGTPRRHLLTTGWSTFVNKKQLVAGDSIVFLKADNGDLCVGVRRTKRGMNNGRFCGFIKEDGHSNKLFKNPGGKFSGESVIAAANLAANGQPFEVFYHPRASTPEFCVKASTVMAAMRIQWCPGMRFKMAFEAEDSSRISWFTGTVSSVHAADHVHWPNSPWKLLQVSWDEPDLLQNVKRVSPWSVEMVSNIPAIHLSPFSPARKKLRLLQPPDLSPTSSLITNNYFPASIQGARHSNSQLEAHHNPQVNKVQPFSFEFLNHDPLISFPSTIMEPTLPSTIMEPTKETTGNMSFGLTISNSCSNENTEERDKKKLVFMLFGQPILIEQQLPESWSGDDLVVLHNRPGETSSDEAGPWLNEPQS